jgi:hypothetical protein
MAQSKKYCVLFALGSGLLLGQAWIWSTAGTAWGGEFVGGSGLQRSDLVEGQAYGESGLF